MRGAPRGSGRSFFLLPLALALLALVVFPVSAFAEGGEVPQYETEVPGVQNEVLPTHPKKHAGHQDGQPNPKAEASGAKEKNGSESGSEAKQGGVGPGGEGKGGNGPSGGNSASGGETGTSNGGSGNGVGGSKEVESASGTELGKNASETSGGSSPVVPILIAVVVLAAISIGVVLYRQRKSDGGPDGHVSSPDAS